MKTKILAIVPYAGMKEIMNELVAQRSDIDLAVEVADLEYGVGAARRRMKEGFDVIISRGGTAQLLRMNTDMPVLEISITVFDVLQALRSAEGFNGKPAIIGYPPLTQCASALCQMMQYDINVITISHETDVVATLRSLADEGYSIFIGDTIIYTKASELGLASILVLSSAESISMILDQALVLSRTFQYTQRQREMIKAIFAESGQDIFVFYDDGRLWFSTVSAEKEQHLMEDIQPNLNAFMHEDRHVIEHQDGALSHTLRSKHIDVFQKHYVMVIHETRELFVVDEDESREAFIAVDERTNPYDSFSISVKPDTFRNEIAKCSQNTMPILLVGESGTGKSQVASLIYNNRKTAQSHFYIIDCAALNTRQWRRLISHEDSPMCDIGATLFFRNAEAVSDGNGDELLDYIRQSTLTDTNKLIFSINTNHPTNSLYFLSKLKSDLPCIQFPVPSLREQISDLPSIVVVYLNKMNLLLGKSIMGFEKDALLQMQAYAWPGNHAQLSQIIRKLAVLTTTPYITADAVSRVLREEAPSGQQMMDGYAAIDIRKPLSEIDYDVVRLALERNHMNQTLTANQLQISRSKLWRMLKE